MGEIDLPEGVLDHYENRTCEDERIRRGISELERIRAREIIRRHLPRGALRILDVGGATGVHAEWLLADGHRVDLVDPVATHVEQARDRLGSNDSFAASIGDGRALVAGDAAYDAVLLFGPLYHLVERGERLTVWREARRVLRHGGVVFGMAISRFASLLDGLASGFLFDPAFRDIVERDLESGQHLNPSAREGWFTTAYFHHPGELAEEAAEAGLGVREVVGVEGMAPWLGDLADRWDDADDRETILYSARVVESEPTLLGLSPHLIAVAEVAGD